jgi:hypothetical protein
MLDLPATVAGKVTAKERFEHQNERIAFFSLKPLFDDVRTDRERLLKRDCHGTP